MTNRDRRADARDRRFGDFDDAAGPGRDESSRIGRSSLFDFEDAEAEGRRDPYAEWLARGSTPADMIADDFPDMPTRIGDWHFRTLSSVTGSVKRGGYRVLADDFEVDLAGARPFVKIADSRQTPRGGIHAFVVTERVKDPAGSAAYPAIVSADDPDTFARRLVSHLDGIQPDEITHPRYDPLVERNLPGPFEFDLLLPLRTKTTYRWSGVVTQNGEEYAWAIDAEGSTNRRMEVFAYPLPELGERAPRSSADTWGVDRMPGEGVGPAAETARRIMRAILDRPTEFRGGSFIAADDGPDGTGDVLRFSFPDRDAVRLTTGDRVSMVMQSSETGQEEPIDATLIDFGQTDPDRNDEESQTSIEIRTDDGDTLRIVGSEVTRAGTRVGRVSRSPPLTLIERGD